VLAPGRSCFIAAGTLGFVSYARHAYFVHLAFRMRMDTELLEIFREVARQGSISGAARRLAYTQSAVSRQVAALEADFGVRLFDRRARGVQLTEHGRCLVEHADSVLARVELARRDLDALDRLEGGRLRIGAFTTATAVLLPRTMATFASERPDVSLSLVEGITQQLLVLLESGDADLAVISAFPRQTLDREHFRYLPLLEDEMLVALPFSHRLARRRRRHVQLAELEDEAWIGADASAEDRLLGPARLASAIDSDFPVREWTAKLGLVAAGLGATLVPSLAAQAVRADVALLPLDRSDAPARTVYAATLQGRTPAPAVKAFIDILRQTAEELGGSGRT
jgi:DNA-binding transcriptional LysR family regulator